MQFLNMTFPVNNLPELDGGFVPLAKFFAAHQREALRQPTASPFAVAVEREAGHVSVYETYVTGAPTLRAADAYYLDRLVKCLLWVHGGNKLYLCGDAQLAHAVADAYAPGGARAFDRGFMQRVYGAPFVAEVRPYAMRPAANDASSPIGRHLAGCRIGFDAGGSDRKVSAVIDGEAVYAEEILWHPKEKSDPDYHYAGILQAMRTAAAKMPRVDAIGVSSAGVYIDNRCKVASLFLKVSEADFKAKVEDIYIRAAGAIGPDIPLVVANDGDVTALAGAMGMDAVGVLGIAMGTSQAAGYVDTQGNITGWLNELAFAPVDGQGGAMRDEWSGDIGCGVKYFSQDGIIKLAGFAGIPLQGATPAQKLKEVQDLMATGDERATAVYRSLGVYLGHALGQYALFYDIRHVLMLGRVTSGKGGDLLLAETHRVLAEEYPHCGFAPTAPDEKARRVGQSVAAASLPAGKA